MWWLFLCALRFDPIKKGDVPAECLPASGPVIRRGAIKSK
jgi:hypothetical protein